MNIKIIASIPRDKGQDGIEALIGKTYRAITQDKEDREERTVSIYSPEFDGIIRLNKGEFKEIKESE